MDGQQDGQQDFSGLLLEYGQYFSNQQPIIKFIQNESTANKKAAISAWNQQKYENNDNSPRQSPTQSVFNQQRRRIQGFLSTIRSKNNQFNRFYSKLHNKRKNSSFDNIHSIDNKKNKIFLNLNSTIINFQKFHSQSHSLQNQQKMIFEKLSRKHQKSKIIPKQISINPSAMYSTIKPHRPAKDCLLKNLSLVYQGNLAKIHNPQSKQTRQITGLRNRFASTHYKKRTGVLNTQGKNQKMRSYQQKPSQNPQRNKTLQVKVQKVNSFINETQNQSQMKHHKTEYSSPKISSLRVCNTNQFLIYKVRQDVKYMRVCRAENQQNNQIRFLGSTLAQWKNKAQKRLNRVTQRKD